MHELPLNNKKLNDLIQQCRHHNVFPIYLPNYLPHLHKHPINNLLKELVDEAFECLSCASDDEIGGLIKSLPQGLGMLLGRQIDWREETHRKRIAIYYIVAEVERSYYSFKTVVNQDISASKVLEVYPELKNKFDNEGLLYIDESFMLLDGGIKYKDHILHYHQFLRRGYTSEPNFDFTGKFIEYYHKTKNHNSFRIAIDHRRIMLEEYYCQIAEYDNWFLTTFKSEDLDNIKAIGLATVYRGEEVVASHGKDLERTEVFWSYHDGIKSFELEEISGTEHTFEHYYFNRYVHSEREINRKIFRHVDGAVKTYLEDSYSKRQKSSLPNHDSYNKIKLWRIDGNIDIQAWTELISLFFKGNEMIIDYFNRG